MCDKCTDSACNCNQESTVIKQYVIPVEGEKGEQGAPAPDPIFSDDLFDI